MLYEVITNNTEKYIGSDENWEKAESAIIEACKEKGLDTIVETGEAAFYGPKLDFMVKDAIGRKWQLGTIQVDYNLPERRITSYNVCYTKLLRCQVLYTALFNVIQKLRSTR